MTTCEIIWMKDAKGWKWRAITPRGEAKPQACNETYGLFYECVVAARAKGLNPNIKCS